MKEEVLRNVVETPQIKKEVVEQTAETIRQFGKDYSDGKKTEAQERVLKNADDNSCYQKMVELLPPEERKEGVDKILEIKREEYNKDRELRSEIHRRRSNIIEGVVDGIKKVGVGFVLGVFAGGFCVYKGHKRGWFN